MKLSTKMETVMGAAASAALYRKVWAYHWNMGICPRCGCDGLSVLELDEYRNVVFYKCTACCERGSGLGMDEVPPTIEEVLAYESHYRL
jgi:transcription elongation factor Elf1